MIEAVDPISLPLWLIAAFAAAQYPLGLMLGAECSLCCCRLCNPETETCCGSEFPRATGQCCDGEWRTGAGICCAQQWETGEGQCCGDQWETGEGECCGGQWETGEGDCCNVKTVYLTFASSFGSGAYGKIIRRGVDGAIEEFLTGGGGGYAVVVNDEVQTAEIAIEVNPLYLDPVESVTATLLATIDSDRDSQTFGMITAITIDDPGDNYDSWSWQLAKHWFDGDQAGECCRGLWYPAEGACPEGKVFVTKSATCCGCFNEEIFDPETETMVPTVDNLHLLDCPDCNLESFLYYAGDQERGPIGRCCLPGGACLYAFEDDCDAGGGTWEEKCCLDSPGCLAVCCRETADGVASCEVVPREECQSPDLLPGDTVADCDADGCHGQCCVAGEPQGMMTQQDCDQLGGCWAGVGVESCRPTDECRSPFDANCCETVVSGASGLTFTQPRRKRCADSNTTWMVRVTGSTDSEILIHGVPFGQNATPAKRCPFDVSFLVCWDKFHIEPLPCNSQFRRLDATVCWNDSTMGLETLNYSGCQDISLWLGDCTRDCSTTLVYGGPGVTVTASVTMLGDATIEANGGALIFPSAPAIANTCSRTLTLSGFSTELNSIIVPTQPPAIGVSTSLEKRDSGTWKLTAGSTYNGTTQIYDGTLIVGVNTQPASGAFGTNPSAVEIGGGTTGVARLHLSSGVQFSKWIKVVGTGVSIGGDNGSGLSDSNGFLLADEDFTLYAATGGTFTMRFLVNNFAGDNYSPADITIGTASDAGTVLLLNELATTATVTISYGTLHVDGEFAFVSQATALIVDGIAAELRHTADNPISVPVQLTVGAITGNGTINDLTAANETTIEPDAGGEIVIDTAFAGSGTVEKPGSGTLRITATNTHSGTLDVIGGTLAGNFEVIGTLALRDGTSVLVEPFEEILVSGALAGNGTSTKLGDGTLRVTGENTFAGTLELEAGTLAGNFEVIGTLALQDGTSVLVQSGQEILVSGAVDGGGTVTKLGDGTLRVTGENTFAGTLELAAGTLAGDFEIVGVVNVANDATVDADSAGEILLSGTLSGSATLTKDGSGTLRITGVNSFSGEIDIQAGDVVTNSIIANPGGLAASARFTNSTLSVAFTANPASGDQYTLLAGSTTQTYGGSVTLTGTTKTGTYNSATATVTIN